jgi:hypothetical protein
MDNERLSINKFNRYFILGQLISIGLIILGFFFVNEKQDNILQIAGWLFIVMGIVFIFIYIQRKQRLLWIYKNISPTSMQMKIEKIDDSDSTNYVAYLTRRDKNTTERWKTNLYPPSCNVRMFLNNENQVEVYVDPKNNNPAVIRTTEGLLWVMAGSGSVQNLQQSQ